MSTYRMETFLSFSDTRLMKLPEPVSLFVAGLQFITGPCTSDADCASGCCGFNTGLCAGPVVAQEVDGGCGFGDAEPNDNAARALTAGTGAEAEATPVASPVASPVADASIVNVMVARSSAAAAAAATPAAALSGARAAAAANPGLAGNGQAKQFITGACDSDADCASGCCGFNTGLCAGAIVAQERDGGCGFGDAQPNDNAAKALTGE
jgi:N-methylhydantoinase B/oxoprolinase/acetone carboxylase alpha subunit